MIKQDKSQIMVKTLVLMVLLNSNSKFLEYFKNLVYYNACIFVLFCIYINKIYPVVYH